MSYNLTPKQQELKNYIAKYIAENGCSPSYDEMKDHAGLASKSGIHRMIEGLEERGHIRRLGNKARSIQIIPTHSSYLPQSHNRDENEIPFLGKLSDINREIAKG